MTTKQELKRINEEYFEDRPNAVKFCSDCDLENKRYCKKCAEKQLGRLK